MKKLAATALAVFSVSAASMAQQGSNSDHALIEPLAPLSWLVGHCWAGSFNDGAVIDTHCYQARLNGTVVVDRHLVSNEPVYCGETVFHFAPPQFDNEDEGVILFRYYNIVGGVSDGLLEPKGRELYFPEERIPGERGEELTFQTRIKPINDDRYDIISQQKVGAVWREVNKTTFTKVLSEAYPYPNGYEACSK